MVLVSTGRLSVLFASSRPDPLSVAVIVTVCEPLPWVNGPGVEQAPKVGAFLSTMMSDIGPAGVLLVALSNTLRLFVSAVLVSVFAATLVVRLKLASLLSSRRERPSEAVQAML